MSRSFALIFIMLIYCSVQSCRSNAVTVTWVNSTGTFSIPENTPRDSLTLFAATGATNFTILTQNDTGQFAIALNGTLSSTTELDFESGNTLFSLEIIFSRDKLGKAEFTDETNVSMCIGCASGSSSLEKSMFAFLTALVFGAVLM